MSDEKQRQSETLFDDNLRAIGRRIERPADATDRQVRRWVNLARSARIVAPTTWTHVRRWALTVAAAMVVAAGLFLAFKADPQAVSADDVFRQVGTTLANQPVLHLRVDNVQLNHRRLDFEFIGAEEGRSMYARVNARSLDEHAEYPLALNMTFAREGDSSWMLVRRMQWNDRKPMGHLIPENGSLLIDIPVSPSTNEAVRQFLPIGVHLREVQALIESLRRAVPDLGVRETPDGLVLLEGVITRPGDLDLRMLCDTTDAARMLAGLSPALMSGMTQKDVQRIVSTVKDSLKKRMSAEDFQAVSERLDLVGMVAMHQLQNAGTEPIFESDKRIGNNLRTLLTGARMTIVYDPRIQRLLGVNMDNVGPARGTVQLRFDEPTVNRSLLRRDRFADEPNLKTMTRDEVIYGMLLPMFQPTVRESNQ